MDIKLPGESGARWANGCDACTYGVTHHEAYTGAIPLFEEQAILASRHELTFCTCRAGLLAKQYARKNYAAMSEDGRRLAGEKIDVALTQIMGATVDAPTVHGAEVAA